MSGTKVDQKGLHIGAIVTTGTAPNYLVTIPREDLTSLVDQKLFLKIHQTASTAVTINVNGLGAKALKDSSGVAVTSLTAGQYIDVTYNGVDFFFSVKGGSSGNILTGTKGDYLTSLAVGTSIGSRSNRTFDLGDSIYFVSCLGLNSGMAIVISKLLKSTNTISILASFSNTSFSGAGLHSLGNSVIDGTILRFVSTNGVWGNVVSFNTVTNTYSYITADWSAPGTVNNGNSIPYLGKNYSTSAYAISGANGMISTMVIY